MDETDDLLRQVQGKLLFLVFLNEQLSIFSMYIDIYIYIYV